MMLHRHFEPVPEEVKPEKVETKDEAKGSGTIAEGADIIETAPVAETPKKRTRKKGA